MNRVKLAALYPSIDCTTVDPPPKELSPRHQPMLRLSELHDHTIHSHAAPPSRLPQPRASPFSSHG
jgi:hypothetical protein